MENQIQERYKLQPWCIKKIKIIGSTIVSAVINLFDPRVCENCGKEYYFGQTGKKLVMITEVRTDGWEKHKYHCAT